MGPSSTTLNRQNAALLQSAPVKVSKAGKAHGIDSPGSDELTVGILNNVEDMVQFETPWREMEQRIEKPSNVFQSYDWCLSWSRTCTLDNDCYGIHIITVSRGNRCLLVWPMMTTCSGPFHILRWLSEPYSQYGDVLAVDDGDLEAALALAWQKLKDHPFADSIRLRHVRKDATVAGFLENHARHDKHVDYAPYLEIKKFPTETAYDTRYSKSQRRRRKRIRKNLEQFGPVDFSIANKGSKFLHTLKTAITEKRKWLSERGLYSKPVMSDELQLFFTDLAENGKTVTTVASQLNAGDREVSFEIGLRFKNRHFGYITAHDAALTDASPGRLHMDMSQRCAINDGMDAFDLMVPADPHKKTWSSASVQTRDYFIHINTRGAIYTITYLEFIRPCVRWLYLKAPSAIRRHITRFVS